MEFAFFYGPDKIPFSLDEQERIVADDAVPFHGIISRGLLQKFEEEGANSGTWYNCAHLISAAAALHQTPELTLLQEHAYTCEVLSFSHSAVAVRSYIEHYTTMASGQRRQVCEVWNIKEGHTSSVWKVTMPGHHHAVADEFILNVARDRAAGQELKDTSEKMQAIAKNCAVINMAKVYDIQCIKLKYFDKIIEVVVTRNEFIPDASEIHSIACEGGGKAQYVLVERFLTSEDNPSHISAIRGRKFTQEECSKIESDLNFFRLHASKDFDTPISIKEGDVVWDGEKALIIAVS